MGMNTFLLTTVLYGILLTCITAKNITDFKDCGSKESSIVSLDLSPCTEEPCKFNINTTVVGKLTFQSKEYITNGRVKAYAVIDGVTFPLPISSDACQGYGLTCPINSGQKATFVIKQLIEPLFPRAKLDIKGELSDPQGNVVFCFQVPIQIGSSSISVDNILF